jgi:hypothetical protein
MSDLKFELYGRGAYLYNTMLNKQAELKLSTECVKRCFSGSLIITQCHILIRINRIIVIHSPVNGFSRGSNSIT